jgi:hypothetical protein
MNTTLQSGKRFLVSVITLIFVISLIPLVASEAPCTITPVSILSTNPEAADQDVEINIFGTLYMMEHKPFGMTSGIYGNFVNTGQEPLYIDIGYEIKTHSTLPWDEKEILMENATIPVGSTGEIAFGANFGTGIVVYKVILTGCGESEGFYKEKTAYGICCRYYAFILMQTY